MVWLYLLCCPVVKTIVSPFPMHIVKASSWAHSRWNLEGKLALTVIKLVIELKLNLN